MDERLTETKKRTDPVRRHKMARKNAAKRIKNDLTKRELEVLRLLSRGAKDTGIAGKLVRQRRNP